MNSAIYKGMVRHRRYAPRAHRFSYPLVMFLLDLDELSGLLSRFRFFGGGRFALARFRRADYLGSEDQPLADSVLAKMSELAGRPMQGKVFLLAQLRTLGMYFSPLNVYFLQQGGEYTHMLAEVSNTPWNQRHYYLIDVNAPRPHAKGFHVSPFNPMRQRYHWRIRPPGKGVLLHIESHETGKVFDATMALARYPLNQREINRVIRARPAQTLSVLAGIYWQALRLFVKRVPFYSHPRRSAA